MNKSKLAGSALIVVAALIGAAAWAQDAGVMPDPMHGPMKGHGFDIAAMDSDKDGKVTKAEVEAFQAARMKEADANADGKLSADELVAMRVKAMSARMSEHAAEMVKNLDTDADGLLSATELAARPGPAAMFDKIDANSDGAVTQAEVDAMQAQMHEMRGKHGRHGKHHKMGMMGGDDHGDMMGDDQGN